MLKAVRQTSKKAPIFIVERICSAAKQAEGVSHELRKDEADVTFLCSSQSI